MAWFWDDNLLVKRRWARELLTAMRGLDRWWLTQASIDITRDDELLALMERSGCAGIFLGIESLDDADLRSVDKRQNRAREYKDAIAKLHDRGVCVMAGFISGFDDQTERTVEATAEGLNALGARQLSAEGMLLSATMNGFYGLKQLTGNLRAEAPVGVASAGGPIEHPDPAARPTRLLALAG